MVVVVVENKKAEIASRRVERDSGDTYWKLEQAREESSL